MSLDQFTAVVYTRYVDEQTKAESKMNIYVGNFAYDLTEDDLQKAFEAYGQVASVAVIKDKFSGESRGFGFVEMPSKDEAMAAIAGLNGQDLNGRALTVNEARPRTERGSGGGGGGGRGGGGGGRQRHGADAAAGNQLLPNRL